MEQQPWETLRISKATYYRLFKSAKFTSLIDEWFRGETQAVYTTPKSQGYLIRSRYQIEKYLKSYPVVSEKGLAAFLSEVPPEKFSARKDRHAALSMFSKFLHREGHITSEELMKIEKLYPKKPRFFQPEQKIITEGDLKVILEVCQKDYRIYHSAHILSETALRLAEFTGLTKDSMVYSSEPTRARLSVIGKGNKHRVVPFSRKAQASMKELGEIPKYRWLMDRFKEVSEAIGIPFSAHSFRHYRITQWANNPMIPITTTQRWAGHETLTVTQAYIHINDEMAMRAAYE